MPEPKLSSSSSSEAEQPAEATPRRLLLAILALGVVGLAVAGELARIHLLVHTDPAFRSVCAVSDGVNCETVALSSYSVFAGLPVAVWGLGGYALITLLAFTGLWRRRPHPSWPLGLLCLFAAGAAAASLALATISLTRIDSLCLFCCASYVINAALLVLALLAARRVGASPLRLLRAELGWALRRPHLAAPAVLLVGLAVVGAELTVPAYWQSPGWRGLPELRSGRDAAGHHWIGAEKPRLTIVEFSDYECPHCRAAHKRIRALAAAHPRTVRLIHRHLPLDQACHPRLRRPFHRRACLFAEAAECAGEQGAFWRMNDALFAAQERQRAAQLDPVALAVRLGLDRGRFRGCLREHRMAARVQADLRAALARRLRGTPSYIVGDEVFLGGVPAARLEQLLSQRRSMNLAEARAQVSPPWLSSARK